VTLGDEEMSGKFPMKVCHGVKQRTVGSNIWGAFQALVIEFDIGTGSDLFSFNEAKIEEKCKLSKTPVE
jgi:hypothetical protein